MSLQDLFNTVATDTTAVTTDQAAIVAAQAALAAEQAQESTDEGNLGAAIPSSGAVALDLNGTTAWLLMPAPGATPPYTAVPYPLASTVSPTPTPTPAPSS
jgi:hypothetical protein